MHRDLTRPQFKTQTLSPPRRPPCIDSNSLLGCADTVQIQHGGETYTLCKTRSNKLILTK